MNPTLDDCNEVLDWLDDNFEFGKNLRSRIRQEEDLLFVILTWHGSEPPETLGLYAPPGWVMSKWWIDADRNWSVALFEVKP